MPNFGDFCRSVPGNDENRHYGVKQARARPRGARSLCQCLRVFGEGIDSEGECNTGLTVLVLIRLKFPERRGPSVLSKAGELDGFGSGLPESFSGCHITKVTVCTCGPTLFLTLRKLQIHYWYERTQSFCCIVAFYTATLLSENKSWLPSRSHVRFEIASLRAQRGEWSWWVGDASSEFIPSGEQASNAPKPSNEFRRSVISMWRSACECDGGFRVAQQIWYAQDALPITEFGSSSDGAGGGAA